MSKDKIIELNEQGKTVTDIAKELNVSKAHVSQTLKRYHEKKEKEKAKSQESSPAHSSEPPSSPSEPEAKIQDEDQGPAAKAKDKENELWAKIGELETRNAKLEVELSKKDKMLESLKSQKQTSHSVEEFDDMIKFCFEHIQDADCQTFLAHNLPPRQERSLTEEQRLKLGIVEIRKGGGHSGATKTTLTILRKMRNQ